MQSSSLRSDRAGFYAFLALAMVAIVMAIYMLFTGGGSTGTTVQTATDTSDVTVAPVVAAPVVEVSAPIAFQDASFTASTPVPTPEPTPEPVVEETTTTTDTSTTTTTTEAAAAPADTTAQASAGTPTLGAPTLEGNSIRAVSAAQAFTYVAFATSGGGQTIYDGANGSPKQVTYQYLDGSAINYPLTNPTYFGNTLALRVIGDASGEWAQVALPTRPNGQTGWIKTADWNIQSSNWYVQINTGNNTVAVWRGEELMLETQAVTGAGGTPTPKVTAFIDEKLAGPSGAYGPWLLSLGVFSNAHNTFGSSAGLPKIALHGTNNPALMGQYASNGCIRVVNESITWMYNNVPVGSYVAII